MNEPACIGCGRIIGPEAASVPGLDLCRDCSTFPMASPLSFWERTLGLEGWWDARMCTALLACGFAGAAPGILLDVGLYLAGARFPPYLTALGSLVAMVAFGLRLRSVTEWHDLRWKRRTAACMGLANLPIDRYPFAILMSKRTSAQFADSGFLVETEEALVFVGRCGALTLIPWNSVCIHSPDAFNSCSWLCLTLQDRSSRWVSVREGGEMAWGRRFATWTFAQGVQARLRRPKHLIPAWARIVREQATALAGLKVGSLPEQLDELSKIVMVLPPLVKEIPPEDRQEAAFSLVTMTLSLALVDQGWMLGSDPDRPGCVSRDGIEINPHGLLESLQKKDLSAEAWRDTWTHAGLAAVDLGVFALSNNLTTMLPKS